ncbi:hypothetical protein JCM10296v2_003005 [Rhodotorula toruloides]
MSRTLLTSGYGGKIYTLSFDPTSSSLRTTSTVSCGKAPTWLTLSGQHPIVYTGDEFSQPDGVLHAFRFDASGSLDSLPSAKVAEGPVHFCLSGDGKRLFTANYASGTLSVVGIKEDGTFDEEGKVETRAFKGTGPKKDRQEAPHVHGVYLEPTNRYLFAADLGADVLRIFDVSSPDKLEQLPAITMPPGNGPRHLVFAKPSESSTRTLLYLIEEIRSTIAVFEVEYPSEKSPDLGLKALQKEVSILPPDYTDHQGDWTGAELALSPNGRYLYASNRCPVDNPAPYDTLAIFELTAAGTLNTNVSPAQFDLGGRGPRHFALSSKKDGDSEGKYMAVALERTSEVVVYEVDEEQQDRLTEVARLKDVDQPTCIQWLP